MTGIDSYIMDMDKFKDKKVVLIGGGTGNAVLLRTLKNYTANITVIVSVGDDGGSSGFMRREMGTLPPGDIRNCLVAMADEENIMAAVMNTRFTEGFLKTQNLGNMILVALNKITGSFPLAIRKISEVLAISGRVLPVTCEKITLKAKYSNGKIISGESRIGDYAAKHRLRIDKISLAPETAEALPECLQAIDDADMIIYSPGSLYTSLIPNLLVGGVCEALEKSAAQKYYLANIMTERGETGGYTLSEHIAAIEKHSRGKRIIDTVIYNTEKIPEDILRKYNAEGAGPVISKIDILHRGKYRFIGMDIADYDSGVVRHDSKIIWEYIFQ